jgi:hypothetical protein
MKRSLHSLLRIIAMIQLCMAGFLGIYSVVSGAGQSRDQENFVRYKEKFEETYQQAKTLEAQSFLTAATIDANSAIARNKHFNKTTLIISTLFFFSGLIQVWAIEKVRDSKMD